MLDLLKPSPSVFCIDIKWTARDDIDFVITKSIYFRNDVSICNDDILFQVDYNFDLMMTYCPIFIDKMDNTQIQEIKRAISKTIIEMAKCYNTENRSTIEHLKFVFGNDTVCINVRI